MSMYVCVTTATIRIHPHTPKKNSLKDIRRNEQEEKNGDIRRKREREKTNKAVSSESGVDIEGTRKHWGMFFVLRK